MQREISFSSWSGLRGRKAGTVLDTLSCQHSPLYMYSKNQHKKLLDTKGRTGHLSPSYQRAQAMRTSLNGCLSPSYAQFINEGISALRNNVVT